MICLVFGKPSQGYDEIFLITPVKLGVSRYLILNSIGVTHRNMIFLVFGKPLQGYAEICHITPSFTGGL
jgi:hypothetical protein